MTCIQIYFIHQLFVGKFQFEEHSIQESISSLDESMENSISFSFTFWCDFLEYSELRKMHLHESEFLKKELLSLKGRMVSIFFRYILHLVIKHYI